MDIVGVFLLGLKMVVIFLLMVQIVPILVWIERRGSAFIQNRFGPNRVGPLGLTQLLADLVKFLFKEEFTPPGCRVYMFYIAPVLALLPATLAFSVIPLSIPIDLPAFLFLGKEWGPYHLFLQGIKVDFSLIFILGVSALAVYPLLLAGWGSANKYSFFGSLRASAQVISYELVLGVSLVGIIALYQTFDLQSILDQQTGALSWSFGGVINTVSFLPNWGVFFQPLGFLLFFIAVFAETNRLPFDLPEAESELVAGYHTEYGGLKMNMFYIGEYGHMLVASALIAIFFFGGYNLPFVNPEQIQAFFVSNDWSQQGAQWITALILFITFFAKIFIFLWVFIWVRWTLPRFRYDQLMRLGWTKLLPLGVANVMVTAVVLYLAYGV